MLSKMTAQEYLNQSENKLRTFKREWEAFTNEVPNKLMSLIRSGIRPSVSSSRSGSSIGVSLSFESNMDAAKKYIEEVKAKIERKSDEIKSQIKEIDSNLQKYLDEGVDGDLFAKLVRNLNDWIAYIPKMSFTIAKDNTVTFEVADEMRQVQRKWEKVSTEEVRKKEAARYGIALADLDKHKKYLAAKDQKASARTSADMKKAERGFAGIKGYLDSAELEKACAAAGAELKAKEEEEARIRREREEARRREEAERLRKAVEAYEKKVEEINRAKADYIAAENTRLEKEYKVALDSAKARYDAECEKNMKATEEATAEKARLEQELEKAGLLAFGKKKQLRLDIEAISEKLRQLSVQKNSIDREYDAETRKKKTAYDNAVRSVPEEAEKKFVLPKDPRK